MNYKILLNELTYSEYKVALFLLLSKKEKSHITFGAWLGLSYETAHKTWQRGIKGLKDKGWYDGEKWTKKAKQIFLDKNEEE